MRDLKDRYLPTHAIDAGRLIGEASQVLRDLQENPGAERRAVITAYLLGIPFFQSHLSDSLGLVEILRHTAVDRDLAFAVAED